MRLNFSIKTKIILMNMGILIPIIIFIYVTITNNLYSNVIKSNIDLLTKESYNTQVYISNYIEKDKGVDIETNFVHKAPLINTYLSKKLNYRIQIYDKNGDIMTDSVANRVTLFDKDITNAIKGNKAYVVKKIDGNIYILFSSPIYLKDATLGCVRYIYTLDIEEKFINNMFIIMGILAFMSILISWLLSKLLSEKIVGPIKKLKTVSQKVTKGEYDNRIKIRSGDEIEDLAETFNVMSESIKDYVESLKEERQKQKKFLDNVTHEFKTPLTAIIGYSEIIPKLKKQSDIDESLVFVKEEGIRLLKLVEELLDLSKLGKSEFKIDRKKNNLKEIIEEVLIIINPRLKKYEIEIIKDLCDIEVLIDKDKIKQVILNVLDNAIKYSECTNINIKLQIENEKVILNIIDDGIGIAKENISRLFEPTYRVNNLNSINNNGNGLGLCICKEIMKKQNGDIKIKSNLQEGTSIEIIFEGN
ncbi:sensor histidine kinase [Clostridium taeniosporum]|uniref:histidine kinase n=1 Tax=Clostridium taeniosporum TaxID=394958 RepID=A0A1D7XIJ2_9CLOT|nr:HAMP domain-containing sensor histidine kinase [Clostridium taeniosporum]AOR23157.1 sensor histidine kinase [Clostridium taeniosporum]